MGCSEDSSSKPKPPATPEPPAEGETPAEGELMSKVGEGIYHFWNGGYSSLIVIGESGVLITDPAFTPRGQLLKETLATVTDKPVSHVVLSHEHYDHIGGTEVFIGAKVICHRACQDILSLSPLIPAPAIQETYDRMLNIDLGGVRVALHHPAVGDGVGTTIVHVPSAGVVFSADMYEPKSFTAGAFKEDTNFVGVRIILNELLALQPSYAINAHSPGNSLDALRKKRRAHE